MSTVVQPSQLMTAPSTQTLEGGLSGAKVLIVVNAAIRTLHHMDSIKIDNKTVFDI